MKSIAKMVWKHLKPYVIDLIVEITSDLITIKIENAKSDFNTGEGSKNTGNTGTTLSDSQ